MKNFVSVLITLFICQCMFAQQDRIEIFTHRVGEFKICLLSELQGKLSTDLLIGATEDMIGYYAAPDRTVSNAINAFLVQAPGKNILIDTGLGNKLFKNMEVLGVTPEQIDIILLTHMHGDHIGGMMQNDKIMFPNAEVYIPRPEYEYWMSDDEMYQVPVNAWPGFKNVRKVVDAYSNQLNLFDPEENLEDLSNEVIYGIVPVAAYGHTPGHTGYMIRSGNSRMLVWGDVTHAMAIQMPFPNVSITYDVNPELAAETRERLLDYVNEHRIPIAGMHIVFPAMGRINEKEEGGYIFTPL